MINPTCPIHGEPQCRVDGQNCTCLRITLITSDGTTVSPVQTEGFNKFLRNMRDWNVTLHGQIEESSELFNRFFEKPVREPVPDAFQRAFGDGELDV